MATTKDREYTPDPASALIERVVEGLAGVDRRAPNGPALRVGLELVEPVLGATSVETETQASSLACDRYLELLRRRASLAPDAPSAPAIRRRLEALEHYERGIAPLAAVAEAFGMRADDALVLLELLQCARTPEAILLSDERRAAIDARLLAGRTARRGKHIPSPEAVAREVIASQRIEGIDVRAFVRSARTHGRGDGV